MAVEIDLIKLPGGILRPSMVQDVEKLEHWPVGSYLRVKISKPVNGKFHAKLFALLNVIFEGQERYDNFEHFRTAITVMAGFYEHIILPNGKSLYQQRSISYAKMDQAEKEQLYSKCIDLGLKEFLPDGWTEAEIESQCERVLGFV